MQQSSELSKCIQEYIVEHFPNAEIEQWEHEKKESLNFRILENDRTFVLRVMDECLEGLGPQEIKPMLENYNTAQILRDIGDFPIVVTNSGCIFGSP